MRGTPRPRVGSGLPWGQSPLAELGTQDAARKGLSELVRSAWGWGSPSWCHSASLLPGGALAELGWGPRESLPLSSLRPDHHAALAWSPRSHFPSGPCAVSMIWEWSGQGGPCGAPGGGPLGGAGVQQAPEQQARWDVEVSMFVGSRELVRPREVLWGWPSVAKGPGCCTGHDLSP